MINSNDKDKLAKFPRGSNNILSHQSKEAVISTIDTSFSHKEAVIATIDTSVSHKEAVISTIDTSVSLKKL